MRKINQHQLLRLFVMEMMSLVLKSERCEAQKCQAHLSETSSPNFIMPLIENASHSDTWK